jgi:hypothetical protein
VANYKKKLELLTKHSNSRPQKNSPTGLAKVGASMVERMFAVATMNC